MAENHSDGHEDPRTKTGVPTTIDQELKSAPDQQTMVSCGHFEELELVGRGGMGAVFKAWDPQLKRKVAVKLLGKHDTKARRRFLREARSQAQISHANVCEIFEVGEVRGQPFIAMRYIEGRPLSEFKNELSLTEKVRLMRDVALAIHAAHERGLIHRDIKPSNIMLETGDDGRLQPQVVDFGLSRSLVEPHGEIDEDIDSPADEDETFELTAFGEVTGTPAYMAPEQALGFVDRLDARTDVYSLGCTLYELLVGRPPLVADSTASLLLKVTSQSPAPMRSYDPSIPEDLEAIVARCLAKDPGDRYQTAASLAADLGRFLEHRPVTAFGGGLTYRFTRLIRRQPMAVAATLLTLLIVVSTIAITRRITREAAWFDPGEGGTVALLPFDNDTGDPGLDWVRFGLMQMVAGNLEATEGIEVVPRADVVRAVRDLDIEPNVPLSRDQIQSLSQRVGARIIIAATLSTSDDELLLDYAAHTPSGAVGNRSISGRDPTELANRLALRIAHRLNPDAVLPELSDTYSEDSMANREFAAGLQYSETDGPRRARPYFEVSLDRDPTFTRARLQMAQCERGLGDLDTAREMTEQSLEQAMSRHDRVLEAECLTELGIVLQTVGEMEKSARAFDDALEIFRSSDSRAGLAGALRQKGAQLFAQSKWQEAEALYLEALAIWQELGNRSGQGSSLNSLGMVEWRRGEWENATELFNQAMNTAREVDDRWLQLASLNNLGGVALSHGDLSAAREAFSVAAPLAHTAGERLLEASVLNNLGIIAYFTHDLERTEELWTRTLEIRREAGHRTGEAEVLNNLASLAAEQHDWDRAISRAENARQIQRELGNQRDEAMCILNLGQFAYVAGAFDRARAFFAEAEATGEAVGDQQLETDGLVWQGRAAIRQHKLNDARRFLDKAQQWRPEYPPTRRLHAEVVYSQGRLAQATELMQALKNDLGEAWTSEDEESLEFMQKARHEGRVLPLR